ncbi:MAG: UDP-N-acetylmuramoyl-L-alanine--D-glutamate ligase [Phycisphaerales bacterium]|nr:MAG: UDP-N-acetylmuramoyl-L-alanine--D-glutamate ligase [Phycisphaerales bacterium]
MLVVGLGRFGGGVGATRWLASRGAIVTVTDQARPETLAESVEAVSDLDIALHLGKHDLGDLDEADLVVINPAVRKARSKLFQAVVRRNLPWTTEMRLFCERCPGKVVGVTGTYGKSTTCAMLAEALEACRRAGCVNYTGVHLGGNIGRSLLTELDAIRSTDLVVLEMSNAQLEDLHPAQWASSLAVITNLSPHHLDRHGAYAEYVAAKLNIVGDPTSTGKLVVGEVDSEAEAIVRRSVADYATRLVRVVPPDPPIELRLPGRHNQANAACVLTVCRQLGLDEAVVRGALRSFAGLPHRLEHVRKLDRVDYYNDSKSTSPAATVTAVEALKQPIVAIVGGQRKRTSLAALADTLTGKCRLVICTGESGPVLARAIRAAERKTDRGIAREAGGLREAVELARIKARPGDAILFSPGAPSFDAYANFVDRGRHFAAIVNALS